MCTYAHSSYYSTHIYIHTVALCYTVGCSWCRRTRSPETIYKNSRGTRRSARVHKYNCGGMRTMSTQYCLNDYKPCVLHQCCVITIMVIDFLERKTRNTYYCIILLCYVIVQPRRTYSTHTEGYTRVFNTQYFIVI